MPDVTAHMVQVAVEAAQAAGALLRAAFHRRAGPAGSRAKDPVDADAERLLRARLAAAFPTHGVRAEELPDRDRAPAPGERRTWLVDPHDGTAPYHDGWRGPSVSVGLVADGRPLLGVVLAYAAPDSQGDLLVWAEGWDALLRNDRPLPRPPAPAALGPEHTVLVSHYADRAALANARAVAPARFRPVPSIAYRLALVAAGDAAAASSLGGASDYDVAAGHALLRGAGLTLLDARARPVTYGDAAAHVGTCHGGSEAVARALAARDWGGVLGRDGAAPTPWDPVAPVFGEHVAGPGLLARAQGALLGQLAGDALGSLVEFQGPDAIARRYPEGVRDLHDGGTWATLAGQPTDDSELALMLARTLVREGAFSAPAVLAGYVHWLRSSPFDVGGTTAAALGAAAAAASDADPVAAAAAAAQRESQANGALMRVSPLGLLGHALPDAEVAAMARADAALTHPHPVCCDASAVFAVALAHAVRSGAPGAAVYAHALAFARDAGLHPDVLETVEAAASGPPADATRHQGWVRHALRNALHQLLAAPDLEEGVVATVALGGDTDTNAAIAGALLGAVHGRAAVPWRWADRVLTCRPLAGLPGVRQPRPRAFWPVDALVLAERLLVAGERLAPRPAAPSGP